MGLSVDAVSVAFGGAPVLHRCDLEVDAGEIVVLLGPSGCGKSTLLRTIAGLETPSTGRVRWDDDDLTATPVHERGFGLMFQDHALFPHRDVAGNVAFGLRIAGMARDLQAERVDRVLDLVGLPGFGGRTADTLSGGEAQRVALARSLAPGPRLLMLDEPLASLDRALRDRLITDLGVLLRRLGQAAVYVTHDHDEAFALADRIAVMDAGRIARCGTPAELWADPGTVAVARSLGHRNVVELDGDGRCPLGRLGDGPGIVLLRAEEITVEDRAGAGNASGRVTDQVFRHGRTVLTVDVGGVAIRCTTGRSWVVGETVHVSWPDGAVVALTG